MIEINFINASILFFIIYFASFSIPTGAIIFIVSIASMMTSYNDIAFMIILVFLSAFLGDLSVFEISHKYANKVTQIINKYEFIKNKEKKIAKYFLKYKNYTIFLSRFVITGIGPGINYYSGIKKINRKGFIVATLFGEIMYSIIYVTLGYTFKASWLDLINLINDFSFLIVLIIIAIYFISRLKRSK